MCEEMGSLFFVDLSRIDAVKEFCEQANKVPCEVLLRSGSYVINGKSILGIFSLDTSKPIALDVENGKYGVYFRKWATVSNEV